MENVIIIIILIAIVSGVVWYLIREKKSGAACIGCPYAKQCGGKCNSGCNCDSNNPDNKEN